MIAFAIRATKSRATGYSPYNVLYGRDLVFPGCFKSLRSDLFEEASPEQVTYILDTLIKELNTIHEEASLRLHKMDTEIRKTVEARTVMGITNLQLGDPIYVRKADRTTHTELEVDGINYFVKYGSQTREYIVYFNPRSKRFSYANISNVKLATL